METAILLPGPLLAISAVFLAVMSLAYVRQRRIVLYVSGILYVISCGVLTFRLWPQLSPAAATGIFAVTLLFPILAQCVFLIDYVFAPFCLEMRYLVILWWLLAPLALPLNLLGLALV